MPRYRITTPEQVNFHYETAGLVSRAMAWMIDQAFINAARIIVAVALACGGSGAALRSGLGTTLAATLVLLGFFLIDFGYFTYFELQWDGQTPGKKALGVRVIPSLGGRLRFPEVFLRNIVRTLDTLPIGMFLGGVTAMINPMGRRLGDLAADTLVVRISNNTIPAELLQKHRGRVNTFQDEVGLRNRILARVTREERDLILDLTMRRDELEAGAREEIFTRAAGHFRRRFGLPTDLDYLSDEQTVVNLALVLQGATLLGAPQVKGK